MSSRYCTYSLRYYSLISLNGLDISEMLMT